MHTERVLLCGPDYAEASAQRVRRDGSGEVQIFVMILTGETVALEVEATDTTDRLRVNITDNVGISVDRQRLMFAGKEQENGRTLSSYKFRSKSEMHLVLTAR